MPAQHRGTETAKVFISIRMKIEGVASPGKLPGKIPGKAGTLGQQGSDRDALTRSKGDGFFGSS
jgi:hypothetical protein